MNLHDEEIYSVGYLVISGGFKILEWRAQRTPYFRKWGPVETRQGSLFLSYE